MARKAISKKTRFEVFKRDGFKCQYCGKCAPEVVLNVDHIHPVSKGGGDDMMNYVAACVDCNAGKSDRLLTDDSAIAKQRQQLEELNERREQLEMMLQWREGLKSLEEDGVARAADAFKRITGGYNLNEKGLSDLKAHVKKYGLVAVLDGMETAERYLERDESGSFSRDSVGTTFFKLGGILRMSAMPDDMRRIYYARGILRNRVYVDERNVIQFMKSAVLGGLDLDDLTHEAKTCRNWTEFREFLFAWID